MTTNETIGSNAQNAAAEAAETVANAGKETLETVIKLGADAATEGYRNAADYGRQQADMARSACEKVLRYGRDNIDAVSEASALAIAGAEALPDRDGRWRQDRHGGESRLDAARLRSLLAARTPRHPNRSGQRHDQSDDRADDEDQSNRPRTP